MGDSSPAPLPRVLRKTAAATAIAGGAMAATTLVSSVGAAAYFARRVLTPDRRRPDDTHILAVGDDGTVTLGVTPETVVPGRYGLWLDRETGHVRLGDIVDLDRETGRVRREVLGVDAGTLAPGFARWNQYFYAAPPDRSLGLRTEYVDVETELGSMPAWVVPAAVTSDRWAILVHGRGARRHECIRAVRPLHDQGINVLIPSYRNDLGARSGPDGRYNLGLSEWRDIEDAGLYAVRRGARDLTLVGWSMGGAIVLQTLARSWLADHVSGVVLDAPVIDWADVLTHHAALNGIPAPIGGLGRALMGRRAARRLVGVHDPVDVAQTNWVARAHELRRPMLVIHSIDDEFVPVGPSLALAAVRPDLVTMEPWDTARHTKEWNTDPQRWEDSVAAFVAERR
jgi:pimeloyl-ACP methyl ester carboxylesterase